jgi:hypothetical protein
VDAKDCNHFHQFIIEQQTVENNAAIEHRRLVACLNAYQGGFNTCAERWSLSFSH